MTLQSGCLCIVVVADGLGISIRCEYGYNWRALAAGFPAIASVAEFARLPT